jgi:hypothetical protein
MNIAKVIRAYFIFVMAISCVAVFSYNSTLNNFIVSVLHINESGLATAGLFNSVSSEIPFDNNGRQTFISKNENDALVNFRIMNNPEGAYAPPGSTNVPMMAFSIKTNNEVALLKDLKLKIVGVDSELITKAVIGDDKELLEVGGKNGEYFVFKNINHKINSNSIEKLILYVDLSEELHTGQRFRMDIEKPEDIVMAVGPEPFTIDAYYPIEGEYLSVARARE